MNRLLVFIGFICLFIASSVQKVEGAIRLRIIGGDTIDIEDAPYQVSIMRIYRGIFHQHTCGGSIISKNLVLTAAHCVSLEPKNYKIHAGTNNWNAAIDGGKLHLVVEIIRHKNYKEIVNPDIRSSHDIAILKISSEFELNGVTEKIIKLADKDDQTKPGDDAFLAGWGFIDEQSKKLPRELQGLELKIMDFKECARNYAQIYVSMTEYSICAEHPDGDKDMCNGDSGSPLVVKGKQVGIASWSGGYCATPGLPGVYTDVAKYRDWIDETMATLN